MKVYPLAVPLPDEGVAAVQPAISPTADAGWHRRLNLFTGRALSDTALSAEQNSRAGRLATSGQALSPGVVAGLEVGLERAQQGDAPAFFYHISPGMGLAASGEDVVLAQPLRVAVRDVPVYAPAVVLGTAGGGGEGSEGGPSGPLLRRLGPSLGQLIGQGVTLPPVGVLLLQPVETELIGELDPQDPCEIDPQNDAFADWQLADACRLIWYAWPEEQVPLPAPGDRWRNRLVYAVFGAEQALGADDVLPWEEVGVPIALVGFDSAWTPLFADRHAVVRAGGRRRRRASLVPGAGSPSLWQARIQQFAEQLAAPELAGAPVADLAAQFSFLPPCGLLPKDALEPRAGRDHFFPPAYIVEAAPVPLEQLDAAIAASAGLAPFYVSAPDQVRVAVPVPQIWYEPRLLIQETVDPAFQQAIDSLVQQRTGWLQRRLDVRAKVSAIHRAITGAPVMYPTPDPNQLEDEGEVAGAPPTPEPDFGTTRDEAGTVRVTAFEQLKSSLGAEGSPVRAEVVRLDAQGQVTGTTLDDLGIQGFIGVLQSKIDQADDRINFGFLRVQTDIYRIRQLMLGNVAGTRLATSPALASIAQGQTAAATQEQLASFYQQLKGAPATGPSAPRDVTPEAATPAGGSERAAPASTSGTRATGLLASAVLSTATLSATGTTPAVAGVAALGATGAGAAGEASRLGVTGGTVDVAGLGGTSAAPSGISAAGALRPATGDVTSSLTVARLIEDQASAGGLLGGAARVPTADDVTGQVPIAGKPTIRTVTIAERLEEPKAPEAKNFTAATKYDVVKSLATLPISLEGLAVPGMVAVDNNQQPIFDPKTGQPQRTATQPLKDFADPAALSKLLADPDPQNGDEAAFFASGVDVLDHTIATLRLVEGRVQAYRAAIDTCRQTLATLQTLESSANARLSEIEQGLAQARHDVSVARALLAEEQARVDGINQRRDQIIAEQVPFLAYYRPRATDLLATPPVRALDPGLTEAPVPACLAHDVAAPPELTAMVDLLRDSPARWFTVIPPLLDRLDRIDLLQRAALSAKLRAQVRTQALPALGASLLAAGAAAPGTAAPATPAMAAGAAGFGAAIAKVLTAQRGVLAQQLLQTAQLDLAGIATQTWQLARDQVQQVLTLGDVIEGSHGKSDVAQQAARELDSITRVAACLYAHFGQVLPVIRLTWAERLSEYDAPVNLRNLGSLPRWSEIDVLARRELQQLVDWLYQRVDPQQPGAVGLISDLVRVCILLASHAPVDQIIAGHVTKPVTVAPGGRVPVAIDPSRVRIGMQVLLYAGTTVAAQGVVEDLAQGVATTRIVQAAGGSVRLDQGARAHFVEQQGATHLGLFAAVT